MTGLLARAGARVVVAASGFEGAQICAKRTFDLIVSDLGMPAMDGYEFIRLAQKHQPNVPCVAVTAFGRANDKRRAANAGFKKHMTKPVDSRQLISTLTKLLPHRTSESFTENI